MANTTKATAETVCEHCGEPIVKNFGNEWVVPLSAREAVKQCPNSPTKMHIPRTQPSQELRIPDDLKKRYEYCMDTKGLYDFPNGSVAELIERIARLEGSR